MDVYPQIKINIVTQLFLDLLLIQYSELLLAYPGVLELNEIDASKNNKPPTKQKLHILTNPMYLFYCVKFQVKDFSPSSRSLLI